jgi:hypothetical protein
MARLRGIEAKRRIVVEDGGLLGAEKVGEILTISRQAVEKRRKAGKLMGVSLGRGYGYPAWQLSERGTLSWFGGGPLRSEAARRLDEVGILHER